MTLKKITQRERERERDRIANSFTNKNDFKKEYTYTKRKISSEPRWIIKINN